MESERPLADPNYEAEAERLFPLDVTPEEYAARHAHEWLCFSFDDVRFADARLDRWIQRLGDILFSRNGAPSVAELRQRLLTEIECARIQQETQAMQDDP